MIDFHCHLLPNIDDGPTNIDESVVMAAKLLEAGFKTIYCTPHLIKGSFDADNHAVISSVSTLQTKLKAEKIGIEILTGREYYLDEFLVDYLKDPMPLGETRYIMIEIPNHASTEFIKENCFRIKRGGFIPMIAHPERCSHFAMPLEQTSLWIRLSKPKRKTVGTKPVEPTLLDYLKDIGCAFQANLGSFAGWYGQDVQHTADYLKNKKVFTHFGTDVHSFDGVSHLLNLDLSGASRSDKASLNP